MEEQRLNRLARNLARKKALKRIEEPRQDARFLQLELPDYAAQYYQSLDPVINKEEYFSDAATAWRAAHDIV